ncbi:type VI secretion system Vgr family protein [soil metagenome]
MSLAPHTLQIAGEATPLAVIAIAGEEILGGLYRYEIICEAPTASGQRSAEAIISLLRQRCELRLGDVLDEAPSSDPGGRSVWGIVTQARLQHRRGVPLWHITLEPRLAALRHQRLNQVFLDQTSVHAVQAVLGECGLSAQWQDWQTSATYPVFAQRTCHEQDALGFVLWLLEYEGIGLRFEHTEAGERLVFFDDTGGYDRSVRYRGGLRVAPPAGLATDGEPETLTEAALVRQAAPVAVRLTEYDHQQAHLDLSVRAGADGPDTADGGAAFATGESGSGDVGHPTTVQHHGEHYKTLEAGQRLAAVRLEAQRCRQEVLQAQGPLIALRAGSVIRVDDAAFAGHWLVTRLRLHTHRDGRLVTRFEASDAEQMWRPARVTPRPRVHGLLAAKVVGGASLAQLDETGRYRIQYPWQVGSPEPGAARNGSSAQAARHDGDADTRATSSKAIRMAQTYAGPGYGLHAPLKDNTEVWLTHAHGDPDRPLILGATHHDRQPDVVTARDASRNVIRTGAGNKLRLEDRQGEEHIKLHTPHGTTQLHLGHAVDHTKAPRGQGVELRTQGHGAVRTGQQLLITTGVASPRAGGGGGGGGSGVGSGAGARGSEARRTQSSAETRATLESLSAFIGNRSTASGQVGARPHQSVPSANWVRQALKASADAATDAPSAASPPNQVHWALGGQVNAAPTIALAASKDIGLWSIGAQDWLAGGRLQIAAKDASRLHIEQGGRKAFVSAGHHETTVSKGCFHLVVEGSIVVQSQASDVSLKAASASVMLTNGGHAGINASGSAVYQAQVHTARAGAVKVQGGSSAQVPAGLQSRPLPSNGFSKRFQIKDGATGQIKANTRYWLTVNGKTTEGITDAEGYTHTAYSHESQPIRLEAEEGGLELRS